MEHALEGAPILDVTRALAGPYGSMILTDLGAEIVKIERPGSRMQLAGPYHHKGMGAYYMSVTEFDSTGPYRDRPTFDITVQALGTAWPSPGIPTNRRCATVSRRPTRGRECSRPSVSWGHSAPATAPDRASGEDQPPTDGFYHALLALEVWP